MTTIWRKFRGLPTWAQILAVVAVLGLVGAAGGSGSGKTEPKEQAASGAVDQQSTSTTASTASPAPAAKTRPAFCLQATQHGDTPASWASKYQGQERWVLASPTGGLWLTTVDPTGPDASGLTLPLNDQARRESQMGVDVKFDAPIYKGAKASDKTAKEALECAG
jgi:hypothetical protein